MRTIAGSLLASFARRALAAVSEWPRHALKMTFDYRYREIRRLINLKRYQPTITNLLGVPFRISDGRAFVAQYREIVEGGIYDFRTNVQKPLILDLGANIGLSIWFFKKLYPDSRIIAFEPDRHLFQILSENVRNLALTNVELFQQAAWSSNGEIAFFAEGSDSGRALIPLDCESYEVKTVSLRPWLHEPVSMLKIDIEGAETVVLPDIANLLINVENLFMEYHSFADRPQCLSSLLKIVEEAAFRVHMRAARESRRPLVVRDIIDGMDCQLNIFAYRDSGRPDRNAHCIR